MPRSHRDDYGGPLRSSRTRLGDNDGRTRSTPRTYQSPKRGRGGVSPLLICVLVGGGMLMLGALVTLGVVFIPKLVGNPGQAANPLPVLGQPQLPPAFGENPRTAFEEMCHAARSQDYGRVYDRFDNPTQKFFASTAEAFINTPAFGQQTGLKGREAFIAFNQYGMREKGTEPMDLELFKRCSGVNSVQDKGGDVAIVKTTTGTGKTATVQMIKQDGTWRVAIFGAKPR